MKQRLKFFLFFFSLFSPFFTYGATNPSLFLSKLDSLITNIDKAEMARVAEVNSLRRKRNATKNEEERFYANNLLFEAYCFRNADSAMKYLNDNFLIAEKSGDEEKLSELKLKKSFLLIASGILNEAQEELDDINVASLPLSLKKEYYSQMVSLYGLLGNYSGISNNETGWNHYYDREQNYKDSLTRIIEPEDENFLFYQGWSIQGVPGERQDSIVKVLENAVNESSLDNRRDAMNAYILAILYKEKGNNDKYLEYMAKSAVADVTIGNREIASLIELAKERFDANDIDRAYSYIGYCLDASLNYPNRVRALTLLPVHNRIIHAYQERNRKAETRTKGFLIAVCILAFVLALAVVLIIIQFRRLKLRNNEISDNNKKLNKKNSELENARFELDEANKNLNDVNEKLKHANEELTEVNYVKEEYVGYVFSICSQYIKKMEDLRRSINVKAKKKLWKEIEEETSSHQLMSKRELKEFYSNFDSIFLHIFPDFVSDFNNLLLPEERIEPKDDELLTTDLRIYALVRLGITDSVKIAEFLHCSPQTVYNYRFKIRNRAVIPKEQFAEAVKNLGKVVIQ